jgi:transitional endoplasmic reticulum ATPase
LEPVQLKLTPAEQESFDGLMSGLPTENILVLHGSAGTGKTTILREIARVHQTTVLGAREFMEALEGNQPLAVEESFLRLIDDALASRDLVIFDDLHLLIHSRHKLLGSALAALCDRARELDKRLLFSISAEISVPDPLSYRAFGWQIDPFTVADYQEVCTAHLDPDQAERLNFGEIFRFAPKLTLLQLRKACTRLRPRPDLDTEQFTGYLREVLMVSNVELDEVTAITWQDLKGVDDVIRSLEAKIALPFENLELSARLGLKPKRGVLLAGPPGTGKTTIGRALAHRLKSKFFLIDGTVVAGSGNFYQAVGKVFEAAKRNAPAIIFIDDSDVIFANDGDKGFYRYLLTKLDGLESASNARVCVMMTAMDAGSLPPALLRSGRIELWLETRLPDEDARAAILNERIAGLPGEFSGLDMSVLASASRGLTGADLKAVVEDAKLLWAHHSVSGDELRPIEYYFLEAMDTVRANKRKYHKRKPAQMAEPGVYDFPRKGEA